MHTNYVKTRKGELHFFDDRDPVQVHRARFFVDSRSGKLDVYQTPPALTEVSVFRPLLEWSDVLEIGETRVRVLEKHH